MERQTNFSGMLGVDKPEWQVRYSDGMRFTRPFGCPVRTLRNGSSVLRDWWGAAAHHGMRVTHMSMTVLTIALLMRDYIIILNHLSI